MGNIIVGRYQECEGWQGWIEPDDKTWIMFIDSEGHPIVYLNRDPVTGAVR
jgi:hypothetical protein